MDPEFLCMNPCISQAVDTGSREENQEEQKQNKAREAYQVSAQHQSVKGTDTRREIPRLEGYGNSHFVNGKRVTDTKGIEMGNSSDNKRFCHKGM